MSVQHGCSSFDEQTPVVHNDPRRVFEIHFGVGVEESRFAWRRRKQKTKNETLARRGVCRGDAGDIGKFLISEVRLVSLDGLFSPLSVT